MRGQKRFLGLVFLLACAFAFPAQSFAQFTTVTATVQDPNGIPYANGSMSATLVPGSPGGYTLNGQPYSGQIANVALDTTGSFTVNFGSNASILPAGTQWLITVRSNPGGIPLPLGTGPQAFTATITISGATQNISSTLNALAPKLTNFSGSGGGSITGCSTTGGVLYENGTANTATCGADFTFNSSTQVATIIGAINVTASAVSQTPLAVDSFSTGQTAPLGDINNQSSGTADAVFNGRGRGLGSFSPAGDTSIADFNEESAALANHGWVVTNRQANIAKGAADSLLTGDMGDTGLATICGGGAVGDTNNNYTCFVWNVLSGITITDHSGAGGPGANAAKIPLSVEQQLGSTADTQDWENSNGTVLVAIDNAFNLKLTGSISGSAKLGIAAVAGTPSRFVLPTVDPTIFGSFLTSDISGSDNLTAWSVPGITVNAQTGTTYPIAASSATTLGDRGSLITTSNASPIAVSLGQAGSTGFTNNFNFGLTNISAGLATITPTTSTINGAASQIVADNWTAYVYSDNTNYRANVFPSIAAFPSCSGASNALTFTTSTGALGCNTLTNISGLTTGFFSKAASATSLTNTLCDEAITTANTITCTDTAGFAAVKYTSTGTTAGFMDYPQGTTSAAVAPCNAATSICEQAPTSVTAYLVNKPGVAANGLVAGTNTSSVITQNFTGSSAYHAGPVTIGSGSSIGATSLCSTTNCTVGDYDVGAYVEITTACTTTGSYIVWLGWTDDGSAKNGSSTTTFFPFPLNGSGVPTTVGTIVPDAVGNYAQAHIFLHTTGAANNSLGSINYGSTAVACGSGGPMVGKLFLTVTPLS